MLRRKVFWAGLTVLFTIFYLGSLPFLPYQWFFLPKALPCLTLAVAAYFLLEGISQKLLVAALSLSAFGDAIIVFNLTAGGFTFLCVQVIYFFAFFIHRSPSRRSTVIIVGLGIYLVAALAVLAPKAEGSFLLVGSYMAAICFMAMAAAAYRDSDLVLYGALLFLASDTAFVINKFWMPFDFAQFFLLTTYYIGQILIVFGVVIAQEKSAPSNRLG